MKLTQPQLAVLRFLEDGQAQRAQDIVEGTGKHLGHVQNILAKLRTCRYVTKAGSGYSITPAGSQRVQDNASRRAKLAGSLR